MPLGLDPFPLAALADVLTADKKAVLEEHIYKARWCDLGSFSRKIRTAHPTSEEALADGALQRCIGAWARQYILHNTQLHICLYTSTHMFIHPFVYVMYACMYTYVDVYIHRRVAVCNAGWCFAAPGL